jgi:hypothetical protein
MADSPQMHHVILRLILFLGLSVFAPIAMAEQVDGAASDAGEVNGDEEEIEEIEEIEELEVVQTGSLDGPAMPVLWPIHAVIAVYCALLFLINALIARRRKQDRSWLPKHKTIGLTAPVTLLIGLGVAYYMVDLWDLGHIRVGHAYAGLVALVLAILLPILGLTMGRAKAIRTLHVWIGRTAICLMILAAAFGLRAAGLF